VGNVTGGIFSAPPAPGTGTSFTTASNGLADANTLYNNTSPASKPGGSDPGAGELGGLTLAPGIYKSASGTFKITNGDLTLDAMGNPNAVWIFQTASGLTVGSAGPTGARSVILKNGAVPKNVYWHVGSAATINGAGGGVMVGTIIASAGITFSTPGNAVQTVLDGRALSLNASVTLVNTTINVPN
ncbi:MAG TPA: ice-binding family protein, partial [Flavitalea sp.]|nr:ice-binding family protein [Flavitalea sp.]